MSEKRAFTFLQNSSGSGEMDWEDNLISNPLAQFLNQESP